MKDALVVTGLIITLYCIIWVPVGMFNLKMFKEHNGSKATGMQALSAFAPFYNICYSRKLAYGKSPIFFVLTTIAVVLFCLRLLSVALVAVVPILLPITALLIWVSLLLYFLLYIINAVDFCRMLGGGFVTLLFCIVVPMLGYYMLSNVVTAYFYKEEDELSGRFGH